MGLPASLGTNPVGGESERTDSTWWGVAGMLVVITVTNGSV